MSLFSKNMNIMFGSLLAEISSALLEDIPKVTGEFADTVRNYNYMEVAETIYRQVLEFFTLHLEIMMLIFYLTIMMNLVYRRFLLVKLRNSTRDDLKRLHTERTQYRDLCVLTKENDKKHLDLFKSYLEVKNSRHDFRCELDAISDVCNRLEKTKEQLDNLNKKADKLDENVSTTKLEGIEKVIVDGCYNDPENLAYDGVEWTMNLLNERAIQMEIPRYHWNSRESLRYVIRVVEQLKKIESIVQPAYPDGYETQEMEYEEYDLGEEKKESKYSDNEGDDDSDDGDDDDNDPDWVPTGISDDEYDEEDDDEYLELVPAMIKLAEQKRKSSYFFDTHKSKTLERIIDANGLKCVYSNDPIPGYTLFGYKEESN